MDFETAISLAFPTLFAASLVSERVIGGGRAYPRIRFRTLIGVAGFIASGIANAVFPMVVAPATGWLHLLDLSGWGLWAVIPR